MEKTKRETAARLCTPECRSGYACGHPRHEGTVPMAGNPDNTCPLSGYDAWNVPEKKDWAAAGRNGPSQEDLEEICGACALNPFEDGRDEFAIWQEFAAVCLDCPVFMCSECLSETEAEASGS